VMWVLFVGCFSDRARLVTLATASVITYLPKLFRSYRRSQLPGPDGRILPALPVAGGHRP
jgi:hypothetical protein